MVTPVLCHSLFRSRLCMSSGKCVCANALRKSVRIVSWDYQPPPHMRAKQNKIKTSGNKKNSLGNLQVCVRGTRCLDS